MSTKFSTVYDELRAKIDATLTGHTEINNPYFLDLDSDLNYELGWSLSIAPALNSNRTICNKVTVARDFVITLTQRYYSTERDITSRVNAEKAMFNYQLDVLNDLFNYTTSDIIKTIYVSDNGLEFIEGDRVGYLLLQTLVNVEYWETVT